jgi:hypothetical protein
MSRLFVEPRNSVKNRQARARGALGVVVVRLWPSEVRHNAVAEVLCNISVEAVYRFRGYAMIRRNRLAPFLGV